MSNTTKTSRNAADNASGSYKTSNTADKSTTSGSVMSAGTAPHNSRASSKSLNDLSNIGWIWTVTKPFHGRTFLLCFLSVGYTVLSLVAVIFLRDIINAAATKDRDTLIYMSILLVSMTLFEIALRILTRYIRMRTTYRLIQHLGERLFRELLSKDFVSVSHKHSAEWMNRLILDIDGIAAAMTTTLPNLTGIAVNIIGSLFLIFRIAPGFLTLIVVGGAGLFFLNYSLKEPLMQRQRQLRTAVGLKNIYLTEHLSKLLIVKSFNREEDIAREATSLFDDVTRKNHAKLRITLLKDGVQSFSMRLAYLLVLLYCAINILRGKISYGTSVMFMRLMSQISMPLADVSSYVSTIFDINVSTERLREAESYPDDPEGPVKSDDEIHDFYKNEFDNITILNGAFSYHIQEHEYEDSLPKVFTDVNFSIPKLSCTAITGVTGSGKSTLFKLLMSFFSLQRGEKILCTKDRSEIPLDSSYRRLFAYVPQGNQLMTGTIREMVTFGTAASGPDVEEKIWIVLEEACAKEFVQALPDGLDTPIKERGAGLSEGQLQRIAIARALYTERPILLLDEATSALDENTEQELLLHLKEMTDRTILFVTHRLNALSICDKEIHINGTKVSIRDLHRK